MLRIKIIIKKFSDQKITNKYGQTPWNSVSITFPNLKKKKTDTL